MSTYWAVPPCRQRKPETLPLGVLCALGGDSCPMTGGPMGAFRESSNYSSLLAMPKLLDFSNNGSLFDDLAA